MPIKLFVSCCTNVNLQSWPSSWCEKNSFLSSTTPIDPPHDSSTSWTHLMRCSFWAHASCLKPSTPWFPNLMSPCDQSLNAFEALYLLSSFHPFDYHESSWLTPKHPWMCCSFWACASHPPILMSFS